MISNVTTGSGGGRGGVANDLLKPDASIEVERLEDTSVAFYQNL
jgi:hypothetical protein